MLIDLNRFNVDYIIEIGRFISKIGRIWTKNVVFWTKNVKNRKIVLKFDQIRPDSTIFGPNLMLVSNSDRDLELDRRNE